MEGNPGNGKDKFYYSVSEYERRKNPNISNEEVAAKVDAYRAEPEKFHAMAYKDISGGKTIDKKTLQRVSELQGIELDPNRLSPSDINFVDNDKLDLISEHKKIQEISSSIELPIDATDADYNEYWERKKKTQVKAINKGADLFKASITGGIPSAIVDTVKGFFKDDEDEKLKDIWIKSEKQKKQELTEMQDSYYSKLPQSDLSPIPVEDFFADARKKTEKTKGGKYNPIGVAKAIFTEDGDIFAGNDAQQERQNANIDSQAYIKVLEDQVKVKLQSIADPKERELAVGIIKGQKPEVDDQFKPSKQLESFVQSFSIWNEQNDINATQFGSIIDKQKKTYNQQLSENRQKKQQEVDKNQSWFSTNDALKIATLPFGTTASYFLPDDESPSVARTWVNQAINKMIDGVSLTGTAFHTSDIEQKIKDAKESGNKEEYLRLQRSLALDDFKRDNNAMEETLQRSDLTGPIWEDRVEVDGFRLQVNSKGEFQRMVDIDGKTVHTLSSAQEAAVNKYLDNPKSYKTESGWSRSWGKSLVNAAGQTTVEMVPMIAGGIATAPLRGAGLLGTATANIVPTAAMFVPQYSTYFKEEFERTGNWSRSSTYATAMAGVESMAEWLGGGVEKRLAQNLAGKGVTPDVIRTAGQRAANITANTTDLAKHSFIKQFMKELAKDNLQEVAEEIFTLYAQSSIDKTFGKDGHVDTNELLTTLMVTPLATAPMSAVSNISNYKNSKTDFKNMILAAASDLKKTEDIMVEMVSGGITSQSDAKKKMDLVKAVSARKDNYSQRSAGMNLSFTEEENGKLEDYMFEEAVGEINGKKVDYTKEVDAIIAAATKRAKLDAATEKNDPVIPQGDSSERMKKPLRTGRRPKNEKGYVVEDTVGPDGSYSTVSNDDKIQEGEISLNFNITNDDAEILSSEIQDIAAAEGIPLRMDVAKDDNNTDVPLRVSFNSPEHAQIVHEKLKASPYYNQMVPQKTDRILGKKIDEKVQFGVRNLKDIRKAQDIIENSTKDEDGNYLYSNEGLEMIVSPDEYAQYEEILFAADKMWQSATTTPAKMPETSQEDILQSPSPLNELRTLVNERAPQADPQTRVTDEKGFERLNVKSDANLQDAFDYTDGDKKEIPVFRNGQKGVLRVDEGGAMEFDNGTQIIEYGNINDQRTSTLSELGFTLPEDFKVKNGNIVIDGELYQNPYSSPDAAITRDEDGNIISVELEKREIRGGYNGIQVNDTLTPVTFTGQRAVDVATILMENELATNKKLREEFEAFPAPNIEPSFVPQNVTIDQLGEILLDYFPDKPALAMETAKIYFAQAVRMSTIFPQQYPTPAAYIIEKINKETVENVTDIERLKAFLTNIINTTDNQQRIDFAQRALDNINRINAIKIQTPEELITEINSKPLSHISLGPKVGMGQNEANGTYLSTEVTGNRYEIIKTPGAKIYSAKVNIKNPYDLDANMDDINSLRNRNLPAAIQKYIADNKLTGNLKKQLESVTSFDSDILETFVGFDQYVADAVTADLQSKGYDSLYSRESQGREGYLVVFDKNNVKLTEKKFKEKTVKKTNRGKATFSKINNLIDSIDFTIDPMIHAIRAVVSGRISRDSYLAEVSPSTEQALDLILKKVLTIQPNGVTINQAAENLPDQVDEMDVRNNIIDLLNSYNYQWMLNYVTVSANADKNIEGKSPEEIRYEEDPEFRAMVDAQMEEDMRNEEMVEREIYESIPEELYADIIDIENVQFSPEEIANFEEIFNALPEGEPIDRVLSILPFDPEFEFINEQIENKVDEIRNEDANKGVDGEIVAGEEVQRDGEINGDRQEVADQGGVIERSKDALREIIALTDEVPDYVSDGTWNGEGLLGFDEDGNVVLTRFADSNEGLTKSGKITDPKTLRNLMNSFGGEQIPTSGIVGGISSYGTENGVVGTYRIPLAEFKELMKQGYIQFAGFGNKEFVLSPHIASKYLTEINGEKISTQNTQPKVVDEIDRLQKLDQAINQLAIEKRKQKELEKEVTQLNKDIVKNANENQPNLFGEAQPNLGIDDPAEQRRILNERKLELDNQRVLVYELEKQIEDLRDLRNQAVIDFESPGQEQQVSDDPIEQEIVNHADTIRNKFRQEFTSKGIPPDQVDAAIALMDIRANNWAKEEVGRKPDDWYSKIADVRSEDFVPDEPISDIVEEFQAELPPIEAINFVQRGEGMYANRLRGTDVQTGRPVTINTLKNKEKAPYLGSRFGQDVEPSGNYVTQQEIDNPSEMWTKGTLSFENPLVIDVDENSLVEWKRTLSNQYGNKKGKSLTKALQEAGYDGIITRNNQNNELGEIIIFDDNKSYKENNPIQSIEIENISEDVEFDTKKSEVARVERLEDFGEKIGGAKKDLSQKLAEITGSDIATKPLSKSFPEPNYKKLVEEGVITQEGAIFLKFFYQNIPSKPRKEYRIPQWTRQVQNGIDLFRQVIEADNTKDFDYVQKMMDSVIVSSTLKRDYRMFSETMKGLGFPDTDVKLGDFSIKQFENGFYTNEEGYKVKAEEKYTIVKGYSIVKDFPTMEDAIRGLGQILFSAADKKVGTKFDIYQDTRTKKFFVGKKGTKVIRIVDGFDTAKEAREFLKEQQESVQGIWDNMKNIPDERRSANRERIGIDWRNGRNISSEEFGQTFGFRGVEFGNWVNNQERQSHVNEAFDALMDLSSALGVSPKALSLNGELGLAFGARGSGKALAHYEPGKVVINLTKKKGAGSLAHEWWHALDNYFSRTRGLKDNYLTESPRQRMNRDGTMDESIRVEIINEFKNLMKTITSSKIKERSAVLDGPRSKQYWSTDIEMSARAFENYIIEKLGQTNHRNDYLANFKETGEWISDASQNLNALENYPYPLADESPAINEAFQSLFEAMHEDATGKLYQDDKGAVETLEDGRKVIIAMNAPDFSTMVHEIAHIFESELSSDEQQIVKDFGGSEPFARAFENYLREGNAPNQEIQSLFDKFKNWMTNIYRMLKGSPIDVKITPEIRQIFDRLLSEQTPQEIVGPIDNTAEQITQIQEKLDQLRAVNRIKLSRLQRDPRLSNSILQLTNRLEQLDPEMGIEAKTDILAEMDQIASDMINEMIIMGDIVAVDKQTGKPCS